MLPPPLPQPAEAEAAPPSEAPFPFDKSSGNAEVRSLSLASCVHEHVRWPNLVAMLCLSLSALLPISAHSKFQFLDVEQWAILALSVSLFLVLLDDKGMVGAHTSAWLLKTAFSTISPPAAHARDNAMTGKNQHCMHTFDKTPCGVVHHLLIGVQGLMEWHRSHWLKVRQHVRVKASKRKARYKQRMELLNSHAQITVNPASA